MKKYIVIFIKKVILPLKKGILTSSKNLFNIFSPNNTFPIPSMTKHNPTRLNMKRRFLLGIIAIANFAETEIVKNIKIIIMYMFIQIL